MSYEIKDPRGRISALGSSADPLEPTLERPRPNSSGQTALATGGGTAMKRAEKICSSVHLMNRAKIFPMIEMKSTGCLVTGDGFSLRSFHCFSPVLCNCICKITKQVFYQKMDAQVVREITEKRVAASLVHDQRTQIRVIILKSTLEAKVALRRALPSRATVRHRVALDGERLTMVGAASVSATRLMGPEIKGIHGRISALGSPADPVERHWSACDIRWRAPTTPRGAQACKKVDKLYCSSYRQCPSAKPRTGKKKKTILRFENVTPWYGTVLVE
ncbi:hypothetical protein M513_02369 [Trichuris suis]|uniref:Uncharacterized protein n=1 Tax=Trichuris suis TaxID=68888 RepID=A0A085MHJ7_9BILA|nr:hypothetical protein M513_02369 [Trichuris suis]